MKFISLLFAFVLATQASWAQLYIPPGGAPGLLPLGTAAQQVRVNAGGTALEYFTPSASGVTSVTGTTDRITSTGGTTPVIDISASYVGQNSITMLGTITSGGLGTGSTIGSGVTGTTQSANDNSTKMATTAYVNAAYGGFRNQTSQTVTTNTTLTSSSAAFTQTNQSGATTDVTLPLISTVPGAAYFLSSLDTGGGATTKARAVCNASNTFEDGNSSAYFAWQPFNRAGGMFVNDGTYWHAIPEMRVGGLVNSNRGGSIVCTLAASGPLTFTESPVATATGQLVVSTSNNVDYLAQGTTGQALLSAGAGSSPAFGTLDLAGGGNGTTFGGSNITGKQTISTTTALTATSANYIVINSGAAITLPQSSTCTGKVFYFKYGTSNAAVAPFAGDTIFASSSSQILCGNASSTNSVGAVISDGAGNWEWYVIPHSSLNHADAVLNNPMRWDGYGLYADTNWTTAGQPVLAQGFSLNTNGVTVTTASTLTITATSTELQVLDATSNNIVVTLSAVSSSAGKHTMFFRKDSTANTVTIQRAGSDTIDGATSITLPGQYASAILAADATGSFWHQVKPNILQLNSGGNANLYGSGEMNPATRYFSWQCPSNVSTTMKGRGINDMGSNWSVNNNLVYTARQGIQSQTAVTTSDRGYFNSDNLIQTQQKPVMAGWIVPSTGSIGRINWGMTVNQTNCLDATYTNSAVIVWDQQVGGNYLFKHGTTSDDLGVAPSNGVINDFVIDFSDGTNMKVWIDGTLRLTTSTDLPTNTTYLMALAGIKNLTAANAARSELGIGRIALRLQ